jgi:hypothetical protein
MRARAINFSKVLIQCAEGEARRIGGVPLWGGSNRIEFPEALNRHFKKDFFSLRNVWLLRVRSARARERSAQRLSILLLLYV